MSNGGSKSKRVVIAMAAVVVGLPVLAVCGMVFWFSVKALQTPSTPSKRPEIERILGEAEAKALEMDARWQKAMKTAGTLPVGPPICLAEEFRLLPKGEMKKALGLEGANGPDLDKVMRNVASYKATNGASNEMVVKRSALSANKSPMSVYAAHLIQGVRSELASGASEDQEHLAARASALVAPSFWTRDLTVVIEREVAPRLEEPDAGTFESGMARGLAYVFDYQQEKLICVAEFFSTNSEVVEFAAQKGSEAIRGEIAISDDLRANILESAKHALYRTDAGAR